MRKGQWKRFLVFFIVIVAISFKFLVPRRAKSGVNIDEARYAVNVRRFEQHCDEPSVNKAPSLCSASRILGSTFLPSKRDESMDTFLRDSNEETATIFRRTVLYLKMYASLSLQRYFGWSKPSALGFLNIGHLYVASEDQFRELLSGSGEVANLLDVGSGDGSMTEKIRKVLAADSVTCIENSSVLRRAIRSRGFHAVKSFQEMSLTSLFSHAALLNVLDRCDDPGSLLRTTIQHLQSDGTLMIATVLPFDAKVYEGRVGTKWGRAFSRMPRTPLDMTPALSSTFEESAAVFLDAVRRVHSGLELTRWSRLPYVSSGDPKHAHYALDMAIMVFRVLPDG